MGKKQQRLILDKTRLHFIIKGVLVGLLVGLVVSLFRITIEKLMGVAKWGFHQIALNPIYLVVWLVIVLFIVLFDGWLIQGDINIMGSGIPQVEGQLAGELEMKWWSVLWRKWIGGVLAIGSGLFLGREGPSIQLGSAIGQGLAEKTAQKGTPRRVLIAGGAAAGLSAAFNAPIAATLFILEEVYHDFSPLVWTTALAASIAADMVSMIFFGLKPVLYMRYTHALPLRYYIYLIVLGVMLGLLGYLYQYITLNVDKVYAMIRFIPRQFDSIIALVILLPIGIFFPSTLGGGNSLIVQLGNNVPSITILVGLFLLRLIFSTISYGSGVPGGIFLPILTLGAILGALFGQILHVLGILPEYLIINFIIYAMAGYFACISKAPFTAILLITEMVGSLLHLMPLAVVSIIAYAVVDLLRGQPIYESMLSKLHPNPEQIHGFYKDHLEIPVFAGSKLQGRQVRDIQWPKDCLLISIRRGENEQIPHGDTLIRSGDTLIILTDHKKRAKIRTKIELITQNLVDK
ncbi:chloride channel protein [Ligilactobacillus sp. WILCCON 0076]|uniref:Chloride channel protein n=1 Tax=Ligilactobacillus ubinensis TaxID=2876789 RepID=A0A9X2JLQ9_9LACO|nr:ClC family H(+)/Cl(-) exchange transporter [Ligilactobacillus ubinensis]MCP0886336.1 chloride channel protein [Ligilactobacillus ubinensis]